MYHQTKACTLTKKGLTERETDAWTSNLNKQWHYPWTQCWILDSFEWNKQRCTYVQLEEFIIEEFWTHWCRCGSRIWSRGPSFWGQKLRALEPFGFLMLKYAFSHILKTLFLSFLTSILTPKVDKNRALEFTSINLRHSYKLHLFFNLHEKVML